MVIEMLTLGEFMEKYFPNGVAVVTVHERVRAGEVRLAKTRVEPGCNFCGIKFVQPDEEPERKVVFVIDGAIALCKKCFDEKKQADGCWKN